MKIPWLNWYFQDSFPFRFSKKRLKISDLAEGISGIFYSRFGLDGLSKCRSNPATLEISPFCFSINTFARLAKISIGTSIKISRYCLKFSYSKFVSQKKAIVLNKLHPIFCSSRKWQNDKYDPRFFTIFEGVT